MQISAGNHHRNGVWWFGDFGASEEPPKCISHHKLDPVSGTAGEGRLPVIFDDLAGAPRNTKSRS